MVWEKYHLHRFDTIRKISWKNHYCLHRMTCLPMRKLFYFLQLG